MAYTFKEACKIVNKIYIRSGYKGIKGVGNTRKEWVFFKTLEMLKIYRLENILCLLKKRQEQSGEWFLIPDLDLIQTAVKVNYSLCC